MSIHDMYFSSKNKNHMFSVIRDLVLKETNEDINNNSEYIDLYRFKYSLIFDRSDSDNLIDLNKFLIDEIATIYINDIQSKYTSKNITIKPKEESKTKEDNIKQKIEKQKTQFYINSSERLENSLNRYEYYINLPENKKFSLKQITIPVENNILFSNPIICVQLEIKNEKYDIYCQFKNEILIQNKKYNIYESFQELEIDTDKIIKISILTNLLLKVIENEDKIKIHKIKNIKHKENNYLCLKINNNHDIIKDDNIGIFKNDNLVSSLIVTNKIENNLIIKDIIIDCDNSSDYYILNMNLQNNLLIFYI